MNNRYIKILICVALICCLLFSLSVQAFATTPAPVGTFGGAIASIIAGSMGIDFDYREMSVESINELLEIVSDINEKVWVYSIGAGMTAIALEQQGVQYLADKIKALVVKDNIQDNTSGSIWSGNTYEFDGYKFSYYSDKGKYLALIGSIISVSDSVGDVYNFGDGKYTGTLEVLGTNNRRVSLYVNGNLVKQASWNIASQYVRNLGFGFLLQNNDANLCIISFSSKQNSPNFTCGEISTEISEFNYRTGTIDTTVADNIPSTGGAIIRMPTTSTGTMEDILNGLAEKVLANDVSDVSIEYSEDIGEPVVTDQTIADTPWTDLAGTLDQIKAYLQNMHITVQGHISSALDSISDAVGSIESTIESADTGLIQGFLDNFMGVFRSAFEGVNSHLGIWHYVVSWIGSISSCFSWSLSALSSCGAIFSAPIYAVFAGTVVIAVYRRFGK